MTKQDLREPFIVLAAKLSEFNPPANSEKGKEMAEEVARELGLNDADRKHLVEAAIELCKPIVEISDEEANLLELLGI